MNTERKTYEKLVNTADSAARKEPSSYLELLQVARQVAENSYSPYSKFQVGAALLGNDGRVYTGCNVEQSTYGGGICAERVAVAKAVSEGCRKFKTIAVVCLRSPGSYPCGLCRQFLTEFGIDVEVVVDGPDGTYEVISLKELLPRHFGPNDLKE